MFSRLLLLIVFAFSFDFYADEVDGLPELASEKEKRKMQVRRSKVLATSVARRVTKVVENLDLAGQYEEAQTILRKEKKEEQAKALDKDIAKFVKIAQQEVDVLKKGLSDMKSYDRSMVWYYQAYLNLAYNDNMSAARSNYLKLVKEEDATPQIKLAAYYTLAQLALSEEDVDGGIRYLKIWFKTTPEPTPQAYVFLSQAYYIKGDTQKSFNVIMEAKRLADETGITFRENWFNILFATHTDLGLRYEQVPFYEEALELYPKKKYFINLAGLYNDLDRQEDYIYLLKTAYTKQLLNKPGEFQSLAQMLIGSDNPYWGAEVILTGLTSVEGTVVVEQDCAIGKVLDENGEFKKDRRGNFIEEMVCLDVYGPGFVRPGTDMANDPEDKPFLEEDKRNLTILAQALRAAKERDAAIEVYEKLAKITDDGEAFIAIGNLHYQQNRIDKAVEAINKGIKKGNLKNVDFAQLTLGQAYFELQRFDEAREIFKQIRESDKESVKKSARAWLRYTDAEQERVRNLELRKQSLS